MSNCGFPERPNPPTNNFDPLIISEIAYFINILTSLAEKILFVCLIEEKYLIEYFIINYIKINIHKKLF